jgi:hypothetical protein
VRGTHELSRKNKVTNQVAEKRREREGHSRTVEHRRDKLGPQEKIEGQGALTDYRAEGGTTQDTKKMRKCVENSLSVKR